MSQYWVAGETDPGHPDSKLFEMNFLRDPIFSKAEDQQLNLALYS